MAQPSIYLDYAAATPVDEAVLATTLPYFAEGFFNPSANYRQAKEVYEALKKARENVAHYLGAKPNEIIFTAGGTEANNLAIYGVMRQSDGYPDTNIVTGNIEHESVLEPSQKFNRGEVVARADGRYDLDDLRSKIDGQTVLVSLMYANNEIGTVQPIREISRIVEEVLLTRRKSGNSLPLYFHVDACQAANYLDLHVARLGVDMMTLNGGKIYGFKQSGCLYVKAGIELAPLIDGGGQERGLRSGTENVAGIIGFAKALGTAQDMRRAESARLEDIRDRFIEKIGQQVPAVTLNGSRKYRLPNNVHLTFPGFDNERLLIELDEAGIMAAAGSACSASNDEPSYVLRAIGLDETAARSSLRFTMGRSTSEEDMRYVAETLTRLTKK